MIRNRLDLEKIESEILAPYAMVSRNTKGREHDEKEHDLRSVFERDLARIVHAKAFRRLEYKTQVFVNHEGDHYRTRLTHSLEVAQIARTIARVLRLNENLCETISLAHDLGHTPFGHAGEEVMSHLMKDHGGFEHNRQSLRVVTHLERVYPNFPGLNLSYEVRDGISKHFTDYDNKGLQTSGHYTLEAEVVNIADEIAYNNHDLDDGLRSGMITLQQLSAITLWQETYEKVQVDLARESSDLWQSETIRRLINLLVTDLVDTTLENLREKKVRHHEDVAGKSNHLVTFSGSIRKKNAELKKFLYKNLYQHYRVVRMAEKAKKIIQDLFNAYTLNIRMLPDHTQATLEQEGVHRGVCDYIAGMTDRFAMEEYDKLFDPRQRV